MKREIIKLKIRGILKLYKENCNDTNLVASSFFLVKLLSKHRKRCYWLKIFVFVSLNEYSQFL